MQKFIKWFTPVLALGVAIFIILFLISINLSHEFEFIEPPEQKNEVVQKESKEVWLSHFSKTQRLGYFYPVNEAYIKTDLEEKIATNSIYKLSAPLLDPYQLFCLKEELKQHKLKYYLRKDRNSIELLIYSKKIKKLNSLVRVLKNYQISAKVELYREE